MFENLSLNAACKEQYQAVIEKGFTPKPVATKLMLIVSELGEACEADRRNRHADVDAYDKAYSNDAPVIFKKACFESLIKDTFEDEIADAFLRLMDLCGEYDIDIEKHIRMKAEYNKLRPTKFGKAY